MKCIDFHFRISAYQVRFSVHFPGTVRPIVNDQTISLKLIVAGVPCSAEMVWKMSYG
jgi:hypothetical protein